VLNLMVTPLREVEYVAGVVLFGFIKLALGVGLVALTALVFFSFDITDLGFGLIPIAAVLLAVGWAIALFVIGIVYRFGSGAEAFAWGILFVILPLSGVFYPVDSLPGSLQPIANALPTTHAFDAMRALVDGKPLPWDELALGAIGAAVMTVAAAVFLTKMLKVFRKRGYIGRYL
jgi:ABC-2 type transport system permease protein